MNSKQITFSTDPNPQPFDFAILSISAIIKLAMKRAKIKYLLTVFLILISISLLAGCQLPGINFPAPSPPSSPPPSSPPAPINPGWIPPSPQSQASVLPNIADVVAKVRPSVVAINTEVVTFDIFNRPFTQQGAGSGWIIDKNGIIVTNNHVVEGAKRVTVTLSDDRVFAAETIRTDPLDDLATIKINARNLPAATVGNASKLRVGDWVIAIGNPLGLGISAKEGIVSRVGVPISVSSGQTLYDLIETSAAINPGNSGGPLVNMAGEVIGITSAKIASVGVEGMGYAINIDSAVPIVKQLVTSGYVVRPWLGVVLLTVDEGTAMRFGLAVNQGALVTDVAANSPADKAGFQAGDIIVGFEDTEVTSVDDLIQAIRSSQIGQRVKITFWRGDTKNTAYPTLIESPPP
jgi:serine protease Do